MINITNNLTLAHIVPVMEGSLPVFGTPAQALVIALVTMVLILVVYVFVDHLPQPKKNRITSKNEPFFAKVVIGLVTTGMLATGWDVWWHRSIGRDSFWIPPHIGLYACASLALLVSAYVWRHSRDKVWKHIVFVLLFIPISASFDNFFHTLWGVENYTKPLELSWSPGHAVLALSTATALALLLAVLVRFRKTPDFNFFGNLCFGAIYAILLFLMMPFHPTEGWGQIAGFAGAGILAFIYVAVGLAAEYTMKGSINAIMTYIYALILILVSYGKEIAPQIKMLPHDRPPIWLMIFALLVPAMILDVTKNRFPIWVRGLFVGSTWAGILFGFSTQFFAPRFQYSLTEIFLAVTVSAAAGLTVGGLFSIFHLDDEKHIEKLLKKW